MKASFCHHCGNRLSVYSKFCSSCGTSLSSLANTPEPAPQPKQATQAAAGFVPFAPGEEDGDDYNKYDHIEHLSANLRDAASRLQVEYSSHGTQPEKLGVLAQVGEAPSTEKRHMPYVNTSRDQFLQEFSKEAGSLPATNK